MKIISDATISDNNSKAIGIITHDGKELAYINATSNGEYSKIFIEVTYECKMPVVISCNRYVQIELDGIRKPGRDTWGSRSGAEIRLA